MKHYETLGIPTDATAEQIKKAYRNLVLQYHPDRNATLSAADQQKLRDIMEAHEILGDKIQRAIYDENNRGRGMGFKRPFWNINDHTDGRTATKDNYEQYNDLLAQQKREKLDIVVTQTFTLEEVAQGTKQNRVIEYVRKIICDVCNGHSIGSCKNCNKTGVIDLPAHVIVGFPPGAQTGRTFTIEKQGHTSTENPNEFGDLVVNIKVAEHDLFHRPYNGSLDVCYTHKINLLDLIKGSKFKVPTIYGKKISITMDRTELLFQGEKRYEITVDGMGFPQFMDNDIKGDMKISFKIDIPGRLSDKKSNISINKLITQIKGIYAKDRH